MGLKDDKPKFKNIRYQIRKDNKGKVRYFNMLVNRA